MKTYLYFVLMVASSLQLSAQTQPEAQAMAQTPGNTQPALQSTTQAQVPVDGFYNYTILGNASPFNYPKINPSNIRFYKRLWRDIDLTDPQNQVLALPGSSLIEIVLDGIKKGQITAYDPSDDSFKTRLSPQQAMAKMVDTVLIPIFDSKGNQIASKKALNDFNPAKVTKFRIKEDFFFDKQRGKVESRIIGIAP